MVKTSITYEGDLHCRLHHGPSGSEISTDAPKDNKGKGEAFSPTDLVGAALGSCMLTVMGIYAQRHNLNLKGAQAEILKEMSAEPRRIGKLTVNIRMPAGIPTHQRGALEKVAESCPVHKSLHPDIRILVQFRYPD